MILQVDLRVEIVVEQADIDDAGGVMELARMSTRDIANEVLRDEFELLDVSPAEVRDGE
jgi:hypothetical protein